MKNMKDLALDTQTVEILGTNLLIEELVRDGLEVARPIRDRGVDLIAYLDIGDQASFVAVPFQLKASSTRSFAIDRKYARVNNLVLAFVWGIQSPEHRASYAMTYAEALGVAQAMGYLDTNSWIDGAKYSTQEPSKRLLALLQPHRMGPGRWIEKVSAVRAMTLPAKDVAQP